MNDAFAAIYGHDRRWPARLLQPLVSVRTYLRVAHLLAMFPLGIVYFVSLVTAFAVGGALIWTIVGPVVLLATLYLSRWAGDIEAWLVRHISTIELRRPPTGIERGQSFRTQVWTRLIDPTTWTGLVYLVVQFPLGIAAFAGLVVIGAAAGSLITAPLQLQFWLDEIDLGFTVVDRPREALALVPIGVGVLFAGLHLVNIASALHAWWARFMLGSRARRVPSLKDGPEAPVPDGGQPMASEPPAETMPDVERLAEPVEAAQIAELTPREREVLRLIARGYSNAEIAEAFSISEGTVKTHVKRLLGKLGLRDRTQAVVFAYEVGFATPSHVATPLRRVR
jgi:DNA-binding CsgD family transcriptional regulator